MTEPTDPRCLEVRGQSPEPHKGPRLLQTIRAASQRAHELAAQLDAIEAETAHALRALDILAEALAADKGQKQEPADYYTETQLAAILNCSRRTLQGWRQTGKGPLFVKLGSSIRYSRKDVQAYLDGRTIRDSPAAVPAVPPTPAPSPAGGGPDRPDR